MIFFFLQWDVLGLWRVSFHKWNTWNFAGILSQPNAIQATKFSEMVVNIFSIFSSSGIEVGNDPKTQAVALDGYFHNIPASMFTAFRCYTGAFSFFFRRKAKGKWVTSAPLKNFPMAS